MTNLVMNDQASSLTVYESCSRQNCNWDCIGKLYGECKVGCCENSIFRKIHKYNSLCESLGFKDKLLKENMPSNRLLFLFLL